MRRLRWISSVLTVIVITAPAAHAQSAAQIPVENNAIKPANKLAITAATLDQLVTGLRAERALRDKLAADPGTNADVVKYWKRQDRMRYCDSMKVTANAQAAALSKQAVDEQQRMYADADHAEAHATKAQQIQQQAAEWAQKAGAPCDLGPEPAQQQSFYDAFNAVSYKLDNAGAKAASLTWGQYVYLRQRVLMVALNDENHALTLDARGVLRGGDVDPSAASTYTASEVSAVRAKESAIVALAARDFGKAEGQRKPPGT